MKAKAIFVTGTDTGVGKTVITGLLARYFLEKGYSVITQKWVETGSGNFSRDINTHLKLMRVDKRKVKDYLPDMCPYNFKFASSPHLAARLERKTIDVQRIRDSFNFLSRHFDVVIVEGVGGVLVPFSREILLVDVVRELNLPVLVVAENKLGVINHVLLTVEAIKKRGLDILGIIFNNSRLEKEIILKDNPGIIKKITHEQILGVLPIEKDKDILYKKFLPVGRKIINE